MLEEFNNDKGLNHFLTACFDWIEFTCFNESLNNIISNILLLRLDEFEELPKGRFGYNHQLKWANGLIYICFNADKEGVQIVDDVNGVHVIMTGQGCRSYEVNNTFRELIYLTLTGSEKNRFTRIDLAIDDKSDKIIRFDRFYDELEAGNVSSKWKTWDVILSRTIGDNSFKGRTIYLGKQNSDIFCRLYDKKLERMAKNSVEIDPEILEWTRLEIVFKRDRAEVLSKKFLESADEGLGVIALAVLNHYIRFLIPNPNNAKKRTWSTAQWWLDLLHNVGKLKLTKQPQERTIDDFERFVDQQIGLTIASIVKAKEGDIEWLYKIINESSMRLKSRHEDAIRKYQDYK